MTPNEWMEKKKKKNDNISSTFETRRMEHVAICALFAQANNPENVFGVKWSFVSRARQPLIRISDKHVRVHN
jgi:hypothetical protein